jgi:hypothetical protein
VEFSGEMPELVRSDLYSNMSQYRALDGDPQRHYCSPGAVSGDKQVFRSLTDDVNGDLVTKRIEAIG